MSRTPAVAQVKGVLVRGPMRAGYESILTAEALTFLADLHRKFEKTSVLAQLQQTLALCLAMATDSLLLVCVACIVVRSRRSLLSRREHRQTALDAGQLPD